ncbi:hypothetical protein [Mycoplasma todarodis]|uniref:Uncharacterized protein n=1 Tax=Mycoplasma todarodis TaxID=1937191 RepID=A0A4R0XRW9_9MOLU|nr:hypothetical protein [Mycoplasma todarodis]TCG10319.1 hypothetical protein C4B25_04655 [Mycoplasma todarodis]
MNKKNKKIAINTIGAISVVASTATAATYVKANENNEINKTKLEKYQIQLNEIKKINLSQNQSVNPYYDHSLDRPITNPGWSITPNMTIVQRIRELLTVKLQGSKSQSQFFSEVIQNPGAWIRQNITHGRTISEFLKNDPTIWNAIKSTNEIRRAQNSRRLLDANISINVYGLKASIENGKLKIGFSFKIQYLWKSPVPGQKGSYYNHVIVGIADRNDGYVSYKQTNRNNSAQNNWAENHRRITNALNSMRFNQNGKKLSEIKKY